MPSRRRHCSSAAPSAAPLLSDDTEAEAFAATLRAAVKTRVAAFVSSKDTPPVQSSPQRTAGCPAEVQAQLASAIAALSDGLIERDTEARLLLLAALSGEHLLLLGPPGCAKSELGRRLSTLCSDGAYFERLLTRFTVPEELFGPLSLAALERDEYVRQTQGFLPCASVAFLDEIFRANSAILNALLTILNERLFDNGAARVSVPLICLVAASNELPESDELSALYDRFLFRYSVSPVSHPGLRDLLQLAATRASDAPVTAKGSLNLSGEALALLRSRALAEVALPPRIIELIVDLRTFLSTECEPPIYVSDRRLVKSAAMLRVAAWTSGRAEVSESDALLLEHVCWNSPKEAPVIRQWLMERTLARSGTAQMESLFAGLFGRACQVAESDAACQQLLVETQTVSAELQNQWVQRGALSSDSLWQAGAEAEMARQTLDPAYAKLLAEQVQLLSDVLTLEQWLQLAPSERQVHILARLLNTRWSDWLTCAPIAEVKPLGVIPGSNAQAEPDVLGPEAARRRAVRREDRRQKRHPPRVQGRRARRDDMVSQHESLNITLVATSTDSVTHSPLVRSGPGAIPGACPTSGAHPESPCPASPNRPPPTAPPGSPRSGSASPPPSSRCSEASCSCPATSG